MDLKQGFAQKVLQERAKLLCETAVARIKVECVVQDIAPPRGRFVILFMNCVLLKLKKWLNDFIRLRELSIDAIKIS